VARRAYWHLFPRFRYAADLDTTTSPDGGWNDERVVTEERTKWAAFDALLSSTQPLGFSHEEKQIGDPRNLYHHNVNLAFAYALALAAGFTGKVSVLDWGGGLGYYYKLARALFPELELEYHVKEVPAVAGAGRALLPSVSWHSDQRCLDREYDLVVVNGSLQYMEAWDGFLASAAQSVRRYLLLIRVPVVQESERYAAIQSAYGTKMIHWQFNERELLGVMRSTKLRLVREMLVGGSPYIRGAPEQPEMRGWLFSAGI
jgi:putative methyltransferase (TIGR04325 family)